MDHAEIIEEMPCQSYLVYGRLKRIIIISPRDLVMCTMMLKDKKTNIVYVPVKAIDHPKFPAQKAPIRATMNIGGWVLIPMENGMTKTIYMTEVDPNGMIPKGMLKMGADLQGKLVGDLKNYMIKKHKK